MSSSDEPPPSPAIEDFLGEAPTRESASWRWLWETDTSFPISSRGGLLGRAIVAFKRLLRPFVRAPLGDLWDRQRTFNLILLGRVDDLHKAVVDLQVARTELRRDLRQVRDDLWRDLRNDEKRIRELEATKREGFDDVMRHSDALYSLVDQKLDRYRLEIRERWSKLGALLSAAETLNDDSSLARAEILRERRYLELEDRFRGTPAEISERAAFYLPYLEGRSEVLELGSGRGEFLALLAERGIAARGVDASSEMVERCRDQGLAVERADLLAALRETPEESLGGIVSLHVIEHLPVDRLAQLAALAWRALRPGGVLILETPNPLSLVVAARNFWIDPTHRRPVHPSALELCLSQAGFEPVERLELRPFAESERLPDLDLEQVPEELRPFADRVNQLRDRIDELLFGFQDYAVVGTRPPRLQ